MKSKSRIKIKLPAITTREEAEGLMTSLANSVNAQRKLTVERDARILAVNKGYEAELAVLEIAISKKSETLRAWLESNPDELPNGRKSLDLTSGKIGFRTGTPKLTLISRAWNWAKSMTSIKSIPSMRHFIRVKEEIDKEAILGAASAPEINQAHFSDTLRQVGLRVTQDEAFFVEPNLTDLDSRQVQTTEAA